jgi:hypothetical protein
MTLLLTLLLTRAVWLPVLVLTAVIYVVLVAYVFGNIDVPFLYRTAAG